MYKLLIKLSSLTLLVAGVASHVPCWGPTFQPKTPNKLK
ncbi:MAG: cyclic lactone autoinducer peptide [Oscillospiraceae bacterium]|nr:cyclic lactone autoinducer peptide [Oscillospiraceae bacterium]